jgi:Resolvase, N terminal domain
MKIDYGRVSTRDQNPAAQHDALTAAGCDQVYVDKASGVLASRPELEQALLSANRAGDQLVVTTLDRLGRSLEHLIALSNLPQERGRPGRARPGHRHRHPSGADVLPDPRLDRRVRARPDVRTHA